MTQLERLAAFLARHWDALSGARARRNHEQFAQDARNFREQMEPIGRRMTGEPEKPEARDGRPVGNGAH